VALLFIATLPSAIKTACPQHHPTISNDIDKARFGRELRSQRARRDRTREGPHLRRARLAHATNWEEIRSSRVPPHKAATFTAYDFRHARLTRLAETGNLPGAGFVAGHKRASTTAIYIQPNRRAAERTLTAAGPTGFAPSRNPATKQTRLVGQRNDREEQLLCEGGDLNPYGNNPASTSS
jgi:hypothetical protein